MSCVNTVFCVPIINVFTRTVVTCPDLPAPDNGQISFAVDMFAPFAYLTVAIYTCNPGYGLSGGGLTRTCGGDDSSTTGEWSGTAPSCEGN